VSFLVVCPSAICNTDIYPKMGKQFFLPTRLHTAEFDPTADFPSPRRPSGLRAPASSFASSAILNMVQFGYDYSACKCYDTPEELDERHGGTENCARKRRD